MKYNIILSIIFLFSQTTTLYGQNTFIKKIDKEETTRANQIIKYENRLFVLTGKVCNNIAECSTVMEIDEYGNVLWDKELPFLDVSSRSMVIENDTIFLSGNYNQTQQKFLFHQMSINGGEPLATYDVVKPDDIYTNMFNLGMLRKDDRFYIYGPGEKDNGAIESSLIYVVNSRGNLDTLLSLYPTNRDSDPWQMREDNQGNLVVFITLDSLGFGPGNEDYRKIIKLNKNHDIIWSYTSEEVDNDFVTPKGVILDDDRIVYVTGDETTNKNLHSLRALNPDSTISWQYYSPFHQSNNRQIFRIKKSADGNIFGFGEWGFKIWNPKIDQSPWIFKVSKEGDLIWEQVYIELEEGQALAKLGFFLDAVELDDGSIMAVGGMRSDNNDILIARFDSEGCLIMDCIFPNDVTDVLSDVEDIAVGEGIAVYPNPSQYGEHITVAMDESLFADGDYTIEVLDAMGRLVLSDLLLTPEHRVEMGDYTRGLYFVRVMYDGRVVFVERIVRL